MFFANLVREDRSVLDLFTSNYTFVNERLARHYRIPGVVGSQFRKVTYPDDRRGGLLGQGSILTLTSHRRPHLAGAARQVGDGGAARHAAAGAATERARPRRDARCRGRPPAHRPAAHGAAPRQSGLQLVPPHDRSDRPGARQLRRHRRLADPRQRDAGGRRQHLLRRHAADGSGGSASRAAVADRRAGADLCREPDDLRAGPAAVGSGHAGRASAGAAGRDGRQSPLVFHPGHCPDAGVPDESAEDAEPPRPGRGGRTVRDRCPVSGVRIDWVAWSRDGYRRPGTGTGIRGERNGSDSRQARSSTHHAARHWRYVGAAVPRRDGAGAGALGCRRQSRGGRSHAAGLHRDGARRGRRLRVGRLPAPVVAGGNRHRVRPGAERAQPARAVP